MISAAPRPRSLAWSPRRRAGGRTTDLTEDVATTRLSRSLAVDASHAPILQWRPGAGFISDRRHGVARRFDVLDTLRLVSARALPQFLSNALGYNLTWSTAGRHQRVRSLGSDSVGGTRVCRWG